MQHNRTNKNICLDCFGDLDSVRVCMDCGRPAEDTPLSPHHLAQRCVLIGKYLIVKSIGEGGFGITYLAWDLLRGVKVAIKEYYPNGYVSRMPRSNQVVVNSKSHQAASARSLKRFIDEAKMLTKVKNLNGIVSVKDFFSANGTAYIVMEFVDGISLKAYIKRKGGKLPMNDIVILLTPLIEGLKEIHALGLIHRDISPDNILITKEGDVKLIDFGAAKASHSDGQQLSIVLKQGFAPEEQYRSRSEQGPYTDIYALAVTIYYAITGQLPPESIQRLFKDGLVKPSLLGAQITPSQEVALMKGLSVYAKNRYQDCTSFLEALNKDKFGYGGVARSYEYVYNVNREIFGTEKSGRAESEYKGVDGKTVRYDWDSGVDGVEEQILPKSSAFNRTDSNRLADSALAFANWQNRSGNAWQKPPQPTPNIPKTDWRQTGWRGDSQWQPNRQDWNPGQYGRGAGGYDNQNQSPQNTQWGDSQNLGRTKTQNPMLTRLLKKKR